MTMTAKFRNQMDLIMDLIREARSEVPVVNYALAVAALAACTSIAILFLGNTQVAVISFVLVLLGSILLFIFSRIAAAGGRAGILAGHVLIWSVLIFFVSFLGFTISAFATGLPCNWAVIVGARKECKSYNQITKTCPSLEASAWRSIDLENSCEDAREMANEMVSRCPDPGSNYNTLGAANYCLGYPDLALHNWDKAIEHNPDSKRYRRNKGAALIRLKRFSEAEILYEKLYFEYRNEGKFDTSTTYNYALTLLLNNKLNASKIKYHELENIPTHRIKVRFGLAVTELVSARCKISDALRSEISSIISFEPSLKLIASGQLPAGEKANQFEPYIWVLRHICPAKNPFDI